MEKIWLVWLKVSPWLLLMLPIQLLFIELTTTPYLGFAQLILAFVLILYRSSHVNVSLVHCSVLLIYSVLLGIIAETRSYELYATQHFTWIVMLVYVFAIMRVCAIDEDVQIPGIQKYCDWRLISVMCGVFIIALVIRLQNVQSLPIFGGDEASAALYGIQIRDGISKNLFTSGWYEFPALWFVIPAFTHTILPDGMMAVRIHSVIIGAATCMTLVWTLRPLLSIWLAAISGIVLVFIGVHIYFSQIGLNNIYDGLFLVVLLGLLIRQNIQISSSRWFYIGLIIGFSLFSYASSRIFPVIYLVWALISVLQDRALINTYLRGTLVVILVAGIVVAPLLIHYYFRPDNMVAPFVRFSFLSRDAEGLTLFDYIERDTGKSMWIQVWENLVASFHALTTSNSTGWYEFSGGLIGQIMVIPFFIGVVIALQQKSTVVQKLSVIIILLFLLMSSLSHPVGAGQRLVNLLPVVAFLIAFGFATIYQFLCRYINHWQTIVALLTYLVLGSYANYDAYFRQFLLYGGGVGDVNSRSVHFYGQHVRVLPKNTIVDVYRTGDFNREANAAVDYQSRHVDYHEVTDEQLPRANVQVIVVPIRYTGVVSIPTEFRRIALVAMPNSEVLLTIAYHPDLQPYFSDLDVDTIYPPRFGK